MNTTSYRTHHNQTILSVSFTRIMFTPHSKINHPTFDKAFKNTIAKHFYFLLFITLNYLSKTLFSNFSKAITANTAWS